MIISSNAYKISHIRGMGDCPQRPHKTRQRTHAAVRLALLRDHWKSGEGGSCKGSAVLPAYTRSCQAVSMVYTSCWGGGLRCNVLHREPSLNFQNPQPASTLVCTKPLGKRKFFEERKLIIGRNSPICLFIWWWKHVCTKSLDVYAMWLGFVIKRCEFKTDFGHTHLFPKNPPNSNRSIYLWKSSSRFNRINLGNFPDQSGCNSYSTSLDFQEVLES